MANRSKVITLYKQLIKESKKFQSYNYRLYFIKRTRDAFHEHSGESDPAKIQELLKKGQSNLEMLQRQVLVGQMYGEGSLIIENSPKQQP